MKIIFCKTTHAYLGLRKNWILIILVEFRVLELERAMCMDNSVPSKTKLGAKFWNPVKLNIY